MSNRIEGDLNVGRNIYAGGNLNIPGKATIGHNLIVKGWLEAENIKDANKGLFSSLEALKEAYPYPEHGWWALVGDTFPADVYRAEESEGVIQWVATNGDKCPLDIDLTNYINQSQLEGALEAYATKENAEKIEGDISKIEQEISGYANSIDLIGTQAMNALNTAESLRGTVDGLSLEMEVKSALIDENTESIIKHRSDVVKDVARLDAKNVAQDSEINVMKQSVQANANSFHTIEQSLNMFKDEVETKQLNVDNKIANIETLNVTQTNWHKAHSIINLHQFVNFASFDMGVFSEYMNQVPSQLIRNGLIVLFNEKGKWQAQQLVDTDAYTEPTGYVKLDWNNSNLESTIKTIQGNVSNLYSLDEAQATILDEHGGEIGSLKASISALEGKVDALTLRLDSVDLFIREIELRLDAFNSRISALENKL